MEAKAEQKQHDDVLVTWFCFDLFPLSVSGLPSKSLFDDVPTDVPAKNRPRRFFLFFCISTDFGMDSWAKS